MRNKGRAMAWKDPKRRTVYRTAYMKEYRERRRRKKGCLECVEPAVREHVLNPETGRMHMITHSRCAVHLAANRTASLAYYHREHDHDHAS